MNRISTKVFSHLSRNEKERMFVSEVLSSKPQTVGSFRDLVKCIAQISYHNPDHVLFFRGQQRDYTKQSGISSFYPSIYRKSGQSLTVDELKERFKKLDDFSVELLDKFVKHKITGYKKLKKFPELVWAILQHYEVCETPLLDVTHSLRVAASFALNESMKSGYLYAFGFPHPNGSITYSVDSELINIRLLSICPPEAHRPYFQEGFLVGSFPSRRTKKQPNLDIGVRLIAKFELSHKSFWDQHFQAIPNEALYPKKDIIKKICDGISTS